MKKACKKCGEHKTKICIYKNPKTRCYKYVDENGKFWNAATCPQCRMKDQTRRSRALGIKPRDEITEPMNKKGRDAERLAADHFRAQGYVVELTTSMGPDLILTRGSERLTCEVKAAIEKSEPGCFSVQPVSPNRKGDDLIAIVLPGDRVHVETMTSHLSQCSKSGLRAVTKLIRRRAWVGAEECSPSDKAIAAAHVRKATWQHGRYAKS